MKKLFVLLSAISLLISPTFGAERTGTLKRIEDGGEMKIGFRKAEPPMSFIASSGEPSGYTIDLCKAVGDEVARTLGNKKLSLKFVPISSSNRFAALADGTIDILCGATTKTLSRSEKVGFTQLTFITGASLLSRWNIPIDSVAQLEGRKVGVVRDTTTIGALK